MKIILSHPTGNQNVRAAALGFVNADILAEFNTSVASFPGSFLDRLGAFGPFSEIHRRHFDPALRYKTKMFPWREVGRLVASKGGFHNLIKHETGLFSIDSVYKSLDAQIASKLQNARRRGIDAVYAYEDGAGFSFREAKKLRLQCLYDLPIGYWRAAKHMLEPEYERWPEWAVTLSSFQDSEIKLIRKDEELKLADRIFVASQFTAKTLKEFPCSLAPIEVIPYGFPPVSAIQKQAVFSGQRPLKLLFVGGLSQRKGIADLFAAVNAIGSQIELTVVGQKASNNCSALDLELKKHKWLPSLPHHEVLKLMQAQDVLVFPSLFEGFGLVITEAMSQGTPVITTDRTAGPDLIKHQENGWLIEAGSTEGLQSAIEELLIKPKTIGEAGKAALETARRRPWKVYGQELAAAVKRHMHQAVSL
ncbi:Glycogen synthase [Adhaeribacter pallidiroseus]|uniref:Glycogen synthase n=2 Tax=Adhaeribacter pallidiroseus TaxID=2072847 RepID=A0A369QMC1_9BACT|nr:Glycogen synthase [Adhaeribacter pallidiroseus]